MREFIVSLPTWVLVIVLIWDVVWRSVALWKSARRGQMVWFVLLAVLNTVGILPIIYLIANRGKQS